MINIKTPQEIEVMRQGGKILAQVLFETLKHVKPGVSELQLDKIAEDLIIKKGAQPAFKKVPGYRHSICVSTNEVVVHGVPTEYRFKEGDVVGIDCGVFYKGFNTDMAETIAVARGPVTPSSHPMSSVKSSLRALDGTPSGRATPSREKVDRFLDIGKKALEEAIKVAVAGNRVGNISKTIQSIVEGQGYSVVRTLVGHGVGRDLHEEPEVPGFLDKKLEKTALLKSGMTIAVEVIYNMDKSDVVYANKDNWTIKTKDNFLSGLFERTILIIDNKPEILTA